jgi:Domain of unknown function (DUF1772)
MRQIYTVAAVLPFLIFPYTRIVLVPVNDKLHSREAAAEKLKGGENLTEIGMAPGESTPELIEQWRFWNYWRSLMPLAGAIVGAWATLGQW